MLHSPSSRHGSRHGCPSFFYLSDGVNLGASPQRSNFQGNENRRTKPECCEGAVALQGIREHHAQRVILWEKVPLLRVFVVDLDSVLDGETSICYSFRYQ